MYRVFAGLWIALLAGCGLQDAFIGDRTVVARAGDHVIRVQELAEMLAPGRHLGLRRGIAERWVRWWVDYSLFVQRIEAGDSLLDSATVLQTRWPDARDALVDELYARLTQERVSLTPAVVDSAYAAGDLRVIDHILIEVPADVSEREKVKRRRRAEALRAQLAAGGPWALANEANEDPVAKARGGSVGVIGWGATVPEFERTAFTLEPGDLSPVTETVHGYHIIRRPLLDEVREPFARALEDTLLTRMEEAYSEELAARWEVRLEVRAPEIMRDASAQPYQAKQSRKRIGSYRGGRFTAADFIRWLQVLAMERHEWVERATDGELREFAGTLIGYELEWIEARNAGIELPDSNFVAMKRRLAQDVAALRRVLAVDSVRAAAATAEQAARAARVAVSAYLARRASGDPAEIAVVPPFLADKLRSEARWHIRYAAVDRILERAGELRAALDSAGATAGNAGTRGR